MKFLADMPISPKTVSYLKALGHDVYRISEKGLSKAKDREIVDIAESEHRTQNNTYAGPRFPGYHCDLPKINSLSRYISFVG